MQTLRTRFSMLLLVLLTGLSVGAASVQRAKKITRELPLASLVEVQKNWDEQQNIETVEKLLSESGQPYINAGKGVWVIRRHGENLNFQLVLYTEAESLFTEVIVAKGKSLKLDEAKPYVLGLAKEMEHVKLGFDKDDDLVVRNELLVKSLAVDELKTNIERVATAADMLYPKLQQFRISFKVN